MNATETACELRRLLPTEWASLPIYCFDTVDSTNAEGKRMALPDRSNAALILAGTQTAGRGRMDRSFYSPAHTGLYMTLVLRTASAPRSMQGLTPAVAVAAAEATEVLTGRAVDIKWVNDLYQNGHKVGGILVEAAPEPDTAALRLVIGIGINLTTKEFPGGMRAPAGSLGDTGAEVPGIDVLAAAITARLLDMIPAGLAHGFARVLPSYRAHSLLSPGQAIHVFRGMGNTPEPATVVGIADDFSLTVTFPDGHTEALTDGEVSVRSIENACL